MPSSYKVPEDHQLPEAAEPPLLDPGHEPELLESGKESRGQAPPYLRVFVTIAAIALLALLLFGILRHYRQQKVVEAAAHQEEESVPVVNVTKVQRSPSATTQLLPGNMTPLTESYIYARSTGYIKKRYVDIGDRVKQGQLLAEVEAPDLDQQVDQARAALTQAEHQLGQAKQQLDSAVSQEKLAHITWQRYNTLLAHGAVARQDTDQMLTNYQSASATVGAAQANVSAYEQNIQANRANLNRLIALQGFEYVRAPFTGVITARNFDVGALVGSSGGTQGASSAPMGGTQESGSAGNAGASGSAAPGSAPTGTVGSASGSGGELFRMAQINILRILVNVPQESAPSIQVGESASVFAQGYANQSFPGRVTRTSNSIDLNTRTLLTEVDVENPHQMLLPGTYAQVQIQHVRLNPPLLVPGDSIIAGPSGLQIATLTDIKQNPDEQQHYYPPDARQIHIVTVQVGRDYGAEIEIVSGLKGDELVVVNPSDVVQEGAVVKPQQAPSSEGNQSRRTPSEKQPGGVTAPIRGKSDSGGRGASEKPPGASK